MGKVLLYHGTSEKNADKILSEGFKDRLGSGVRNWKGNILSQAGFVYLTRAYPFFYGMNATKSKEKCAVIQVEVDEKDLYPDEDFLRHGGVKEKKIDLRDYKKYGKLSLEKLGNVAVEPQDILRIIGKKLFDASEVYMYSDPSMSPLNYMFCGSYYRRLTDTWWEGGDWKKITMMDDFPQSAEGLKKIGKIASL
jgi:hypothetical protein